MNREKGVSISEQKRKKESFIRSLPERRGREGKREEDPFTRDPFTRDLFRRDRERSREKDRARERERKRKGEREGGIERTYHTEETAVNHHQEPFAFTIGIHHTPHTGSV
jgi:hypothetical protein